MPAECAASGPHVSADELRERRRAERRLRLIELSEDIAVGAETATGRLREAYAARYRSLVGVPPARRHDLRAALCRRVDVTVDEIVALFAGG